MSPELRLRTVLGAHGQVEGLKSGEVVMDGAVLDFETVKPMTNAYRRMARTAEFDVCELAPTTYLAARANGAPIVALPIPMTRRFRHAGIVRPQGSDIRAPKDLEGRRVGVRAYTVTAGVWTRGILMDEYGLDTTKVTWVTDDEEHVPNVKLPSNVIAAPGGRKLSDLMAKGELDAGFAGLAGIGEPSAGETYVDLFEAPAPLEHAWFRRTGIYPIHGLIVVREEILQAHPQLAAALINAFEAAKNLYLAKIGSGTADGPEDRRYAKLAELVGDPLPYGFEANRPSLEALVRYAHEQGFLPDVPPLKTIFLPVEPADAKVPA